MTQARARVRVPDEAPMRYTLLPSTILMVAIGLSGCFSPNLGAAPFNCGDGGSCPGGYVCVENICRLDSTVGGDLGVGLPDLITSGDGLGMPHGNQSCAQVLGCAGSCSGSACIDSCRQMGTATGTADFDALSACLSGDCGTECGGADRSACGQCANTKCKTQLQACQQDQPGNPGDGGPPPTDSVTWQRPDGFTPNPDTGPGEPDASPTFDTIQPPQDNVVGQDNVTPPPDVPMGTMLSCGQLLDCINACQDQTCADGCYARATPEAQMTYDTASACVNNNCSLECLGFGGQVCDLCIMTYCSAETAACM
jgi:hypothetical protein